REGTALTPGGRCLPALGIGIYPPLFARLGKSFQNAQVHFDDFPFEAATREQLESNNGRAP
ncbi:hypothetical protein, partial [uncultured Rikenella sp.]|uniref:hypothetical protein n=1 Tax=uncultured Rikenella sp. TaxID=368003 RepID=UPI002729CE46